MLIVFTESLSGYNNFRYDLSSLEDEIREQLVFEGLLKDKGDKILKAQLEDFDFGHIDDYTLLVETELGLGKVFITSSMNGDAVDVCKIG